MRESIKRTHVLLLVLLASACVSHKPMPQAVYGESGRQLFEDVPDTMRSPSVEILYATDRAADPSAGALLYGTGRSSSLGFGVAHVNLDQDVTWNDLVAWTTAQPDAPGTIEPEVESVAELARFPPTPYEYTVGKRGRLMLDPRTAHERSAAHATIHESILKRLDLAARKQVHVHVHGFKAPFEDSLILMAMSYHMYGRRGVPVVYSWPAGEPGLLRGYTRDRESAEFTIFHLKEFVRTVAALDEVERINISAHSRGTDVVLTALRELATEARASGVDPREFLKIANLVLLAPDLDIEVASQRAMAEGLPFALGRTTIYVNRRDVALSVSKFLFASDERLGELDPGELSEQQEEILDGARNVDLIFYSGDEGGTLGHSYYQAPAVLADLFLLYQGKPPGPNGGRPLERIGNSMWKIDDGYFRE